VLPVREEVRPQHAAAAARPRAQGSWIWLTTTTARLFISACNELPNINFSGSAKASRNNILYRS
jgi:hypothetical protein